MMTPDAVRSHILLWCLTLLLVACGGGSGPDSAASNAGPRTVEMELGSVAAGRLPRVISVTGRVRAHNQVAVYPEAAGVIVDVHVENGDAVSRGDTLLRFRDAEFRERYLQAQYGLDSATATRNQADQQLIQARSELSRMEGLVKRELENRSNLELAESTAAMAEALLMQREAEERQAEALTRQREQEFDNTRIVAPVSGVIGQRRAEKGQYAAGDVALFTIGELDAMRIELEIPERMFRHVKVGAEVRVKVDASNDNSIAARIDKVSPFIDRETYQGQATVEVSNPEGVFVPGMVTAVEIFYGETESRPLIPRSALTQHPRTGLDGVYLATPDKGNDDSKGSVYRVTFTEVKVLHSHGDKVMVSGVAEGDCIVSRGHQNLKGTKGENIIPVSREDIDSREKGLEREVSAYPVNPVPQG